MPGARNGWHWTAAGRGQTEQRTPEAINALKKNGQGQALHTYCRRQTTAGMGRPTSGWFQSYPEGEIRVTATEEAQHGASDVPGGSWANRPSPELNFRDVHGGRDVGLVPVGAIEQHGPHLPTGTDTIVATAVCERAGQMANLAVLPAIGVGVSYGHGTELPGTLSLTPQLLAAVVQQYAAWAATSGLRRLLFVNAHFGNVAALHTATDHLRLFRPDLRVGTADWWSCDPAVTAEMTADGKDVHANRAETSMMLAIAPHLVHLDRIIEADDEDRTPGLVFQYTASALSRNGVTGRPTEATPELGERLWSRVAAVIADRAVRGRTEEPPLGEVGTPRLGHVGEDIR
jgi:creatinine amidohydrolase